MNIEYEKNWRLGAIFIRKENAEISIRKACDAFQSGNLPIAYQMHQEADLHEKMINIYLQEIEELSQSQNQNYHISLVR